MTSMGGDSRFPLRMGGGKSRARNIYAALVAGQGTAYSKDPSALVNRENMAAAHVIARAQAYQECAANQAFVERATVLLAEWESLYGITPGESESESSRRDALAAVENSRFDSSRTTLENALALAVGEAVSVLATQATDHNRVPVTFTTSATIACTAISNGGAYRAGSHVVEIVHYNEAGVVHTAKSRCVLTLTNGDGIYVPFHRNATYPRSLICLSPRPGETLTQIVLADHDGSATVITGYPSNKAVGGLRHYWIVVSEAVQADALKVAKIHKVLGPVLSAFSTYTIVTTDSPFILDTTSPPGSPLGTGAL